MELFFRDLFDRFQELHSGMEDVLQGLPQGALDWVPGAGMNSLAVLAVHTAGSQRYWVGDVVAGEPSGRDRDAEFRVRGLDAAQLVERLQRSLRFSRGALDGLSLEDLSALRTSPANPREFTVGWALAHALDHTALHLGHMQLTRQMWEQQAQG
jgi:uncharacterized damage-inducible protein DinB